MSKLVNGLKKVVELFLILIFIFVVVLTFGIALIFLACGFNKMEDKDEKKD